MEKELITIITVLAIIWLFLNYALDCVIDREMRSHFGYSIISLLGLYYLDQIAISISILMLTIVWNILLILIILSKQKEIR